MPYTLNSRVWLEVGLLAAFCIYLTRKFLPSAVAVFVVFIRFLVPIVYFDRFFRSTWIGIDAAHFAAGGAYLHDMGYSVFTSLFTGSGLSLARSLAESRVQVGPFLWNLFWFDLFGTRICVPVLANVAVTIVAGYFLYKIVLACGAQRRYAQTVAFVMLLHPMVVCYSSFSDVKDSLVYCLVEVALYYMLLLTRRFRTGRAIWLLCACFLVTSVRFYAVLPLAAAFGLWLILGERRVQKIWLLPLSGLGAVAAMRLIHLRSLADFQRYLATQQLAYGIGHFLLTPRPWALAPSDGFLYPAMLLHWVGLPFAALGFFALWRGSKGARLLLLYAAVLTVLYGLTPELGQYRERYQFYFVFIWAQTHGAWLVWRILRRMPLSWRPARAAAPQFSAEVGALL